MKKEIMWHKLTVLNNSGGQWWMKK
jgi:hypothetical protein